MPVKLRLSQTSGRGTFYLIINVPSVEALEALGVWTGTKSYHLPWTPVAHPSFSVIRYAPLPNLRIPYPHPYPYHNILILTGDVVLQCRSMYLSSVGTRGPHGRALAPRSSRSSTLALTISHDHAPSIQPTLTIHHSNPTLIPSRYGRFGQHEEASTLRADRQVTSGAITLKSYCIHWITSCPHTRSHAPSHTIHAALLPGAAEPQACSGSRENLIRRRFSVREGNGTVGEAVCL